MKHVLPTLAGLALLVGSMSAMAADTAQLEQMLARIIPGKSADSITATPVPGLYEVVYGPQVFYVSADGRYLVTGDLVDLKNQHNLTEERRAGARLKAIDAVGEDAMIIYSPKGEVKHTVTVFTDIDCGYCRKLHKGMKEMNDLGIRVRYLAFPRAGLGSSAYREAVSVWCAKDRNAAMDAAKAGVPVPPADCKDNPVAREYQLGRSLDVNGTPAMVLDDGRMLPGYLPPKRLLAVLEEKKG